VPSTFGTKIDPGITSVGRGGGSLEGGKYGRHEGRRIFEGRVMLRLMSSG
jgi:hypothetical protein